MKIENIKIFADGADLKSINELNKNPIIRGFTTNPTLMRAAGVTNYKEFAQKVLNDIDDKPISFEVFADDISEMKKQAIEIASWAHNVNVKIPITNTKQESTVDLITELTKEGITCNVTAIFTIEQVKKLMDHLDNDSKVIVSIFAGRIADTGTDPFDIMNESSKIIKNYNNAELLWASPRELLNIFQAINSNCDIITVPDNLLSKLNNLGKDLEQFSLETVQMFYNDAKKAEYSI